MLTAVLAALALAASPVTSDPPIADPAHRASMMALAIPSHGENLNAVLYTAASAGPHPTVLLLHGFPGNEQNLDLAQAMRRAGWNVLTLHYRGAWGTPGEFTFHHVLEDSDAALTWLRGPAGGAAGVDATRLVVIGHSMGGMATAYEAGHDRGLIGAGLISPASMGSIGALPRAMALKALDDNYGPSLGMHTLAGTSPAALADELAADMQAFTLKTYAPAASTKPLLVVSSDDGLASMAATFVGAVKAASPRAAVTEVHLSTDHSYSDMRIALQTAVLDWLATLPAAPRGK